MNYVSAINKLSELNAVAKNYLLDYRGPNTVPPYGGRHKFDNKEMLSAYFGQVKAAFQAVGYEFTYTVEEGSDSYRDDVSFYYYVSKYTLHSYF